MDIKLEKYKPNKDNLHDDAKFINKAIADCFKNGGGRVIIEKGEYKASTIEFLSNVVLYLEEDAKITLYDDLKAFKTINYNRDDSINVPTSEMCDYNGMPSKFFVFAKYKENIGICCKGSINGNETIFYGTQTKWQIEGAFYPRIPLIYFENCKNIELKDITLEKSAFWTVHLVGDEYVNIDGINIDNNLRMVNCDGIDPDHSKHINITNCNIKCADDGIVLKCTEGQTKYGSCSDIHVSNCNIISTSAAIKIGTETVGEFFDITFENINISGTNRGISIMLRDLGEVRDITFKNIIMDLRLFKKDMWWGSSEGIAITAVPRVDKVGNISNLIFENITIVSENGLLIYGENNNISDIYFKNLILKVKDKTDNIKKDIDLRPSKYRIINSDFHLLTIMNSHDLHFKNCEFINESRHVSNDYFIENSINNDLGITLFEKSNN